jgi:Zn-dependent protease with chaperone function
MAVYLPLLLSAVFALPAPALARRLPPHVATWLLSAGGLVVAAGSSASLALLAFDALAQDPLLAAQGRWSGTVLRHHDPFAIPVGTLAAVAVCVFTVRFLRAGSRRLVAVLGAHRLAAALPHPGSELAVVRSADRQAFAVPGRPGRIAVTSGLLRSLDGGQRRALLEHERSHLRHHHHLHHTASQLAAAVNPLLHRLTAAVELATERWADEDAAAVCPRDAVAGALTRAATGHRLSTPAAVLAMAATDVADRIGALRGPAQRLAWWRVGLPAGLLVATAAAVAVAMRDTERLFELAEQAYLAGQR